jgi:transposase
MLLVVNLGERIPKEHPLTRIKQMAELALRQLSSMCDEIYSGRPSIPPQRLLKASLLMALHTIRSERMFCEQLDYKSVVPLVFEHGVGRAELRPFELPDQSQPIAGARDRR